MKSVKHIVLRYGTGNSRMGLASSRAMLIILQVVAMLIIYISSITIATAQTTGREVVSQNIEWLSLNSSIKLTSKYGISVDGQFRFVGDMNNMQHMVRAGFEYYVSKKFSVVPIGYSYIQNYLYGKQPATYVNNEHRIWQALGYKHGFTRVAVSHRLRFEERLIQSHSKGTNDDVINDGYTNKQFRVRYRAMINIPLNHQKMEPKTWYISIWDEAFISRGKAVTYNEPDQNRIFVGPGYQFTKAFAVQAGFFQQVLIKSNGAKQENNTGFLLQLNYNFDLSKQ